MRVVASLTTMPDRYFKIVETLKSLHRQTHKLDAIYLSLPSKSRRLNIDYPPLPYEITDLCTVVPCTDFGPITKIMGGLYMEDDPSTVIITFDDDMMYPETIVETLVNHHKQHLNSAIGSSGMLLKYSCPMCAITPNEDNFFYRIPKFSIPPKGRKVDSIYGYPGALYVRNFFPTKELLEKDFLDYALVDNNMFINDDIVISGYLSMVDVERRIFPNMPVVSFVVDNNTGERIRSDNEISYNLDKFFQRMNLSIASAKSIGMYSTTEPLDVSETIVGVSFIIVLSVLVLVILFIYIIRSPRIPRLI
jgi:hypothetical protein